MTVQPFEGMTMVIRGDVPADTRAYAAKRLGAVVDHIAEPVLFARVKLSQPDPAGARPATAKVTVDVNGDLVRAQLGAHEMREAIDLLRDRLRNKLEHRAQHRHAAEQRPPTSRSSTWRHGDLPGARPDYYDRPAEERQLVRHKTYVSVELTPDEAAFDMEQLDFDFYLFRDLASGTDAVLERGPDGSYRLTFARPTATALTTTNHAAPTLSTDEAIARINASGERFVFFENAASGRGNVIYHRYDGHYGLIAPE